MSIPTPEQARQLVEHFGGQRPAARGVGVAKTTVWYWLNPEKGHAANAAYYAANREKLCAAAAAYYEALPPDKYRRRTFWNVQNGRARKLEAYLAEGGELLPGVTIEEAQDGSIQSQG